MSEEAKTLIGLAVIVIITLTIFMHIPPRRK